MTIGANSYGTVAEVQALTKRWTNAGSYDTTTTPTLVQVEKWIDTMSGTLNTLLASAGFQTPVTQADAKLACDQVIIQSVAELCAAANSSGRFFTDRALEAGITPMVALQKGLSEWVKMMEAGLENLGVPRTKQAVVVTCTVVNPQYLRTVNEDNSDTDDDEIGVLVT